MFASVIIVGMFILLCWAVANIVLWYRNRGAGEQTRRYFWQMNALWNTVNLLIALPSMLIAGFRFDTYNIDTSLQSMVIRIVAINILADLLYIAVGLWLERSGKRKSLTRMDGYGQSIQLQGAFLFAFDSFLATALIIITI